MKASCRLKTSINVLEVFWLIVRERGGCCSSLFLIVTVLWLVHTTDDTCHWTNKEIELCTDEWMDLRSSWVYDRTKIKRWEVRTTTIRHNDLLLIVYPGEITKAEGWHAQDIPKIIKDSVESKWLNVSNHGGDKRIFSFTLIGVLLLLINTLGLFLGIVKW